MDIRMKTWEEEVSEYLDDLRTAPTSLDPVEAIRHYDLTTVHKDTINPRDYPVGTWFYYPGDGTVAVREP